VDQRLASLGAHTDQEWTQPIDSASGEDVLRDVVRVTSDSLGERLIAAYALGSLAHGGFSPLVSDVDVGLILTDPIQESDADSLVGVAENVRSIGSPLHGRVSVFWGTAESFAGRATGGRFPPLDRLCLLEHGRLLKGNDVRSGLTPPNQTESPHRGRTIRASSPLVSRSWRVLSATGDRAFSPGRATRQPGDRQMRAYAVSAKSRTRRVATHPQ
jgi:hypothetical protein